VWDLKTGQLLRRLEGHNGAVTALAFASSVKLLFSASVDGTICIWTDTGAKLQVGRWGRPIPSAGPGPAPACSRPRARWCQQARATDREQALGGGAAE
jgi:WD40 repeat protein